MPAISGTTKVIALIAHPVHHSPIPRLVNAALEALSAPYVLVPFDVDAPRLKSALDAARALRLAGLSVSAPHKETLCALLDELGPTAKTASSADTVNVAGRRLTGHNTTVWSFLKAVKDEGGVALKGKKALLVGAGGTASSIAAALLLEGVQSLTICNRTRARSEQLAAHFGKQFPSIRLGTIEYEPAEFRRALPDVDLLVNATPSDLESSKGPLVLEKNLHPALAVFDATYSQATPLLMAARRAGCASVPGTRLLLWQAFFSVRQWTGEEAPLPVLERALEPGRSPLESAA